MTNNSTDFGPYRLEQLIGRGGMGEVFRAYDTEHRRTVALKRLGPHLADDPDFQRRFRHEAQNVAQLANPHIVPIHRFGVIDGVLYIDMRFVQGGDLGALVRHSGALAPERAVHIVEQIAGALDEAHANGLVHRDVKPSNVLLDGSVSDFCYLADFGITQSAGGGHSTSGNRAALMGSLAYMAPEQFEGNATPRSDIYSLTCLFFELVTGRKPYEGETMPSLMNAHINLPVPRPSALNPNAAPIDQVIATGMAKQPEARFATAGDMARAARAALGSNAAPLGPGPGAPVLGAGSSTATGDETFLRSVPRSRLDAERFGESTLTGGRGGTPTGPGQGGASGNGRSRRPWLLPLTAGVVVIALVAGIWAVVTGQGDDNATDGDLTANDVTVTAPPVPQTRAPETTAPPAPTTSTPPPAPGEIYYIGETADGTPLAIALKGNEASGYLCDGKRLEKWLDGTVSGNEVELSSKDGTVTVTAIADDQKLEGSFTIDGQPTHLVLSSAKNGGGLYQNTRTFQNVTTRIGWIVQDDGTQVGIRTVNNVREKAPELDLDTLQANDGGETVPAEKVTGATKVILQ